jgi:hypothetical protein
MQKPARAIAVGECISAEEYIRRIDRTLVITSTVIVALTVGLILQMT